ncbi:hypothetical protein [Neptunicella sp.]|uniref:hypothetical protein n=1 Tax=Neptunicella sp. TaxID=2125986 RepID=UPI003F68FEB3
MKNIALGIILLMVSALAKASLIERQLSHQSNNRWVAEYRLTNNSLSADIEEFSLYYDFGLFDNLQLVAAPDGWDDNPFIDNPFQNSGFEFDGIVDFLVDVGAAGIASGETLGGFMVSFDWLGQGEVADQAFEILDPATFSIIDSGTTLQVSVAEPAMMLLYLLGLIALFVPRNSRHYP